MNKEQLKKRIQGKIPFKIKVTPETSAWVQQQVFVAGGRWHAGNTDIRHTDRAYLCVARGLRMTVGDGPNELEEITLEMPFKNAEEVMRHLVEGGKVKIKPGYVHLKEGQIINQSGEPYPLIFQCAALEPYVEPEWYENIPASGVLCWVTNYDDKTYGRTLRMIRTQKNGEFTTTSGHSFSWAIPVTKEEVEGLIWSK